MSAAWKPLCLILAIALSSFTPPTAASQSDDDFKMIVKNVESHYGAKRRQIPFLGAANLIAKFVKPAGVKSFKVAIFDEHDFSPRAADQDFEKSIKKNLSSKWQPLVKSTSAADGERAYIYSRPSGKDVEILAVTFGQREAVVVQAKVTPESLAKIIEKPEIMGISLAGRSSAASGAGAEPDSAPISSIGAPEVDAQVVKQARSRPELIRPADQEKADQEKSESPTQAGSAESEPLDRAVLKLSAGLVNLNVKVTDSSGNPISDLRKEDFTILENGVPQDVFYFEPVTAPLNLVLLLDLSGSTKEKRDIMKNASKKFIDVLGPGDRIAICAFTREFVVLSDFTTDRKALKKSLDKIKKIRGGTAFYDAMWKSLDLSRTLPESRKAVVVITDGVDNSLFSGDQWSQTEHEFGELLSRAAEEDVTIYPIYLDTAPEIVIDAGEDPQVAQRLREMMARRNEPYAIGRRQVEALAAETAGTVFYARHERDLEGIYGRVAAELHQLYSLAYSPKNPKSDGAFRSITVRTSRPASVARTRRGYYAR